MGNNQQGAAKGGGPPVYKAGEVPAPKVTFTEEELKAKLTEQEFQVTQNKGTEQAWSGKHVTVKEDGTFTCVVCGVNLFKTDKKFESGSGWPSFSDVAEHGNVLRVVDESFGMQRTEVVCGQCGAHLGHVFEDGPKEDTGLRYCINSASLKFDPKNKGKGTVDKGTKDEGAEDKGTEDEGTEDKGAEVEDTDKQNTE